MTQWPEDRLTNLMFLMTLGPLAAGCPGDDSTPSNTSVAPTSGTNPTTTGGMADSTSGGAMATSDASTSSNADSTSGGPGTTEGPSDTTGKVIDCEPEKVKGPINQVCIDYAAQLVDCYPEDPVSPECAEAYQTYCQASIEFGEMEYGAACSMAFIDFIACLSQLSCEEFVNKTDECMTEGDAVDAACMAAQ
ncbi:MAG: hypothetical protein K0V04_09520 [Deltaproteobacteria bacterium]|nr:hypothetical protein [Deltaproteobacteria bacterium]